MKHLEDVLALGEHHASEGKLPGTPLADSGVERVAEECFWNAVAPLLEERSADLEAKIEGATLQEHYTRAFVTTYRAREKSTKVTGSNAWQPATPFPNDATVSLCSM